MAQEGILAMARGREKRSLREIADTKSRVSAPAGLAAVEALWSQRNLFALLTASCGCAGSSGVEDPE